MSNVYFYSLSYVDSSYQNVFDFKNKSNQDNYFGNKIVFVGDYNLKIEPARTSLMVDKDYSWFTSNNINYISSFDQNGKMIYYFIEDFYYMSEKSTKLILSVDVWQTFLFDYEILESFVDRCHVNRWNGDIPTKEYEPENINFGENILTEYSDLCKLGTGVVFATTVPIGELEQKNTGGGGENSNGGGDVKNGIISANGLLFVKQEEGFAEYGAYFNGEGFKTGGYGVTENFQSKYYTQLEPFPVSEKKASEVTYNLLNTEFGIPVKTAMEKHGLNLNEIPQYQFDVFVSIAFNYGMGGLSNLNAWQLFLKNPKDIQNIASAIRNLKSNPERRKREGNLFETGVYPDRQILKYGVTGKPVGYVTENNGKGWLPATGGLVDGKFVNNRAGDNWLIPTTGELTGLYPNYPSGKPHNGLDIGTPIGTEVRASKDGVVIDRKELTTSYGKFLKIQHGDSVVIYAHNSELLVNIGDNVKQGQLIAKSGNSGNSTGPHLHWEIRNDNIGEVIEYGVKTVNPYPEGKLYEKV